MFPVNTFSLRQLSGQHALPDLSFNGGERDSIKKGAGFL